MLEKCSKNFENQATADIASVHPDAIFGMMATFLAEGNGKDLVANIQSTYGFEITKKKGGKPELVYKIDLKNGENGSVTKGSCDGVDAVFTMIGNDFYDLVMGKLDPQLAFMQGKMKIKGNMAKAAKFTPDLFPSPTPENMAKYKSQKL